MPFTPSLIDYVLLLVFAVLFLLSGWVTGLCFSRSNRAFAFSPGRSPGAGIPATSTSESPSHGICLLEYFLLIPVSGVLVTSLLLLCTAQLGVFRFRFWLVLLFVYTGTLLAVSRRQLRVWGGLPFAGGVKAGRSDWAILLILLAAWWMFRPVAEYLTTQRDPGEYVSIAVRIAEAGSIRLTDPDFAHFDSQEKQSLFLPVALERSPYPEVMPGFYLVDPIKGVLLPQYFHLFPLWLALAFKLWRFPGLLSLNVWFGILNAVILVLLGERLLRSRSAGLAAALLLVVCPAQFWIVRSPFSEILAQFFLLSGIWALSIAFQEKHRGTSLLAGLLFGLSLLVRLDSLLVVVTLLALGFWSVTRQGRRVCSFPVAPFLSGLGAMALYAALHAILFAYPYFRNIVDTFTGRLSAGSINHGFLQAALLVGGEWTALIALGAVLVLALGRAAKLQRLFNPANLEPWLWTGSVILLAAGFFYGYGIRPHLNSARELVPLPPPHTGAVWLFNELNLPRLGWYMSPAGVVLAFLGGMIALYRLLRRKDTILLPFLLLLGVVSVFYIYKSRVFPDNYWVIRRYVPVVIPGFQLLSALAITSLPRLGVWQGRARRPRWEGIYRYLLTGFSFGLFGFLAIRPFWTLKDIWASPELRGSARQLETLVGLDNDADILLLEHGESQDFFSGPLKCIFHKTVYPLASWTPEGSEFDRLAETWLQQGKRVSILASGEKTRLISRKFQFVPQSFFEFRTQLVESCYDRLPRIMEELRLALQTYSIQPLVELTSPSSVTVNIGFGFGFASDGFQRTELTSARETFRWTGPDAWLELPAMDPSADALLIMRLGQDLPEHLDLGPARVLLNGRLLAETSFRGKLHVVTYPVPRNFLNRGQKNLIEFHTRTFNPARQGLSDDKRELGIMLDSVRLQSRIAISSRNPYRVSLSSESGDVDGILSGFYWRGADLYRWTEPVARISLPVPISTDEELSLSIRAVKSCPDPERRQVLTVGLDGVEIGKAEFQGVGDQFRIYSFRIPQKMPRTSSPLIELRVDPAWTPKSAGESVDWRSLGCAVDWVRIGGPGN